MSLVVFPALVLPSGAMQDGPAVALLALFAGGLTFVEYKAVYPSLIEFRDAPPYNRLRFLMVVVTVVILSLMARDQAVSTPMSRLLVAVGGQLGQMLDFPYSPVRMLPMILASNADAEQIRILQRAGASAYVIALMMPALFVLYLQLIGWPSRRQVFNVWVNLPTFAPTAGGDVVWRLERVAWVNFLLGLALPFLVPLAVRLVSSGIDPARVVGPQALIWTVILWSFVPAGLMMRAVAMARLAAMIRAKRARSAALGESLASI